MSYLLFLAVLFLSLLGCAPQASGEAIEIEGNDVVPEKIDCFLFYRSAPTVGFDEVVVSLSPNSGEQTTKFDQMSVTANYFVPQVDAPLITIVVNDNASGQELTRQLYQLEQGGQRMNQFAGGHGFTGLSYVFYPGSQAELQFYCQV